MAEEKRILLKIELDKSQLEKSAEESEKAIKDIREEMAKLKSENKEGSLEYAKLRAELTKQNKQLRDSAKALNTLELQQAKEIGSLREMREALAAAKIQYQDFSKEQRESAEGQQFVESMLDLKTAINEVEQSFGTFTGTVGNYEEAIANALGEQYLLEKSFEDIATGTDTIESKFEQLNQKIAVTPKTLNGLNAQMEAYKAIALQAGDAGDEVIRQQAIDRAAQLKDQYVDLEREVNNLASDQKNLQGVMEIGEGAIAGFGLYQSTLAALGVEGQQFEEMLLKLQAAQTALTSLQQISVVIQKQSAAAYVLQTTATRAQNAAQAISNRLFKEGSVAAKTFSKALLATGIGALVAGIGLLIANFDKLKSFITGTSVAQNALNETLDQYKEGAKSAVQETNKVQAAFNLAKKGVISKEEALNTYNETLGDAFGKMDNLNDAEKVFAEKTQAYIKAAGLRAQATALFEKAADEQVKALTASMENQVSAGDAFSNQFEIISDVLSGTTENIDKVQDQAVKREQDRAKQRGDIFTQQAERLLMEAQTVETTAGIKNDAEDNLEGERKKRFEEWKKRQAEYLQGAEELALTLRETIFENTQLSLENERKVIEDHYSFLEVAARNNTDALIRIAEERNADLAELEQREKQAEIDAVKAANEELINETESKYNELIDLAQQNNEDTSALEATRAELIKQQREQLSLEIDQINVEYNDRLVQREIETQARIEDLQADRVSAVRQAVNEIEIAEKELEIERAANEAQREKAWKELQDLKVEQLKAANRQIVANTDITEQERLAIIAKNELEIQRLRNETYSNDKANNEKRKADQLALAQSFLATAQNVSDGFFQIKQNELQNELNTITEKYDQESELLQEQLDAQLITEADYISQKSALDAQQRAEESKIKREQWKKEQQQKYIAATLNTALAVTAALSTQPFIPLGLIAAASAAAAGAFQVASIASAPEPKFEKGGTLGKAGIFGGKSHANGGVKLHADGIPIGEAEKDELFVILNKNATKELQELSALNQRTGGVSLDGRKMAKGGLTKFQNGTALSLSASSISSSAGQQLEMQNAIINAVSSMPNPIVLVEDVTSKQSQQVRVKSRANI